MSQNIKKNCNNCKISFRCSILKEELVKNGYDENNDKVDNWKLIHKVKKTIFVISTKVFKMKKIWKKLAKVTLMILCM